MDPIPSTFVNNSRCIHKENNSNARNVWTRSSGCIPSHATTSSNVVILPTISQLSREDSITECSHECFLKTFFVLSESGKLVFCRGENEERLLSLCGVVLTLASIAEATPGNKLNSIRSKDMSIVFSHRYSLIIVVVIRSPPTPHLYRFIDYVFDQILSILTLDYVQDVFSKRKNCDLRAILSGTERLLSHLVDFANEDFGFLLDAVHSLPIDLAIRQQIDTLMSEHLKLKGTIFGLLFCGRKLVNLTRFEKHLLHPSDLHLIVNMICNSNSFRDVESWIPICLPRFDPSGFLYAYVAFLDSNSGVYLVVLTVANDSFHDLSRVKNTIFERLSKSRLLSAIVSASNEKYKFSLSNMGINEDVRHFLYKSNIFRQYVCSVSQHDRRNEGHLLRIYKRIRDKMLSNSLIVLCETTDNETVLGWMSVSFELFLIMGPFIDKSGAIAAVDTITRWIKKMEPHSFI